VGTKGGVYTSRQQATLTRGPVAASTCHHWAAHPNGRLSQHREQQHAQNRRAVRDAAAPAKTAARQPQWNHRLQLDMQGIAQLPASCATGIRCGTNDAASIHGGFEGAPSSGELPGLAAHSSDRAAAGWMVELCVEEWRCSLLYTFCRRTTHACQPGSAPGQGRRTAQLVCAWCWGHVRRSDGLLRVGEAITDCFASERRSRPPGPGREKG